MTDRTCVTSWTHAGFRFLWLFGALGVGCGRTPLDLVPCSSDAECPSGSTCERSGSAAVCIDESGGSSGAASSTGGASSGVESSSGGAGSSGSRPVSSSSSGPVQYGSSSSGGISGPGSSSTSSSGYFTASSSGYLGASSSGYLGASSSGYFGASSSGYFTASSSGYVGSSSGTVASSSSSGFVGSSGGRVEGVPGCAGATCDYSPGMLQLIPSGAGIAFSDGCYQSSVGIGGYAYPVADTQGSTACVVATQLCGIGTTAAYIPGSLAWGSGMGVNVGQAAASGVNGVVTPTAAGLSYAISQLPADGLRIELGTAGPSYCYQIQADAFGTIPWSSFVTDCWDAVPTGATFSPSIGIADVQFIVPAGAAASSWDFCVQSLSF